MFMYSKKYLVIIKIFLIILLLSNTFRRYDTLNISIITFLSVCTILLINDIIRNLIKINSLWYLISLMLSILLVSVLKSFLNSFQTNIFMFIYVIEILYTPFKRKVPLLIFHAVSFLTSSILANNNLSTNNFLKSLGSGFLTYLGIICTLYLSHSVRGEREATKKLNGELIESNNKLKEYSLKVEELSIAKERERMAQELHDSLGHSLMALTMHLEFAEKIFDSEPEKSKDILLKAKNLAKKSTVTLRTVVDTMKEERNIEDLKNSINELIDSFKLLEDIKIDFTINPLLEALKPDIKLCIYKTIRESLTNGIKHGKASFFSIEIALHDEHVNLTILDNGLGSDNIIKSNGLKGIENRIFALGGSISFSSHKRSGFFTKAEIPVFKEDSND